MYLAMSSVFDHEFYILVRKSFLRLMLAALLVSSRVEGNKAAVSTIMSEDGDIVDCVDIYKQPAFDHPLLKNHTIKMRPSFIPTTAEGNYSSMYPFQQIWQKSGSCPEGTIPIQRIRTTNLTTVTDSGNYTLDVEFSNCNVEVARIEMAKQRTYIGATGTINAWDITVEAKEWSLNSFSVFNKDDSFMENGWMASPYLYGDQKSRVFINWLATTKNQGCFNLRCPGFVQVSRRIMLGGTLPNTSGFDKQQYDYEFITFKDAAQGIWWAMVQGEAVGYWPISLFGCFDGVRRVNWGGSVCNTRFHGSHTATQMGSGVLPDKLYKRASYIRNIKTMNSDRKFVDPDFNNDSASCRNCYNVLLNCLDFPSGKAACMYYGGPGGRDCDEHC